MEGFETQRRYKGRTCAALLSNPCRILSKTVSQFSNALAKSQDPAVSPELVRALPLLAACKEAINVVRKGSKSLTKIVFKVASSSSM